MHDFRKHMETVALLLVVGVVAGSSVAAAQTWSKPVFVATGAAEGLSTNGKGTSALIFGQTASGLFASVQTGGVWGTPVEITTQGQHGSIAVAPNGDVLAVWSFHLNNSSAPVEVQAAFFSGGRWGNPITLSTTANGGAALGFDGHSQATLIWEQPTSPTTCGLVEVTGNSEGGFGAPQAIASGCYGWIRLAVNTAGQAIAIQGAPTLEVAPVIATSRDTNGTWGAPVTVANRTYGYEWPNVGLGNNGTVVVIWKTRVQSAVAVRENGVWSGPMTPPNVAGGGGTAAVDGGGNAVIAYGGKLSYRPAGGSFQTPVVLSGSVGGVVADDTGTFAVGGTSVAVRLAGTSTWNQNGPNGGVVIAPGLAVAVTGPDIDIATAAVP